MEKKVLAEIFLQMTVNYDRKFDSATAVVIQRLWYDKFKDRADDLMVTAANLVMLEVRGRFPEVADFKRALDELMAEQRVPEQSKPRALNEGDRRASKEFTDGVFEKLRNRVFEFEVKKEVVDFARCFFTDLSQDSIKRNYAELSEAYRQFMICNCCNHTVKECSSSGFYLKPSGMTKNGWIEWGMQRCKKACNT